MTCGNGTAMYVRSHDLRRRVKAQATLKGFTISDWLEYCLGIEEDAPAYNKKRASVLKSVCRAALKGDPDIVDDVMILLVPID